MTAASQRARPERSRPQRTRLALLRRRCAAAGLRLTAARGAVLRLLVESDDHPGVAELHGRARRRGLSLSLATVYRALHALERAGVVRRHGFEPGRARYEPADSLPHDHLIDIRSGRVLEFSDGTLRGHLAALAAELGYRLLDCRLELYAEPAEPIPARRMPGIADTEGHPAPLPLS